MWSWSLQCTGRGCVWILITIFFGNIYYNLLSEYLFPFFVWMYITIFVWIVISIFCGNIYYHFVAWIFITTFCVNIYYHLGGVCCGAGDGWTLPEGKEATADLKRNMIWRNEKYVLKKWEISWPCTGPYRGLHCRAPCSGGLQARSKGSSPSHLATWRNLQNYTPLPSLNHYQFYMALLFQDFLSFIVRTKQ